MSLLRRSRVLPWPRTPPGAAHPKTFGSMQHVACSSAAPRGLWLRPAPREKGTDLDLPAVRLGARRVEPASQCSLHNEPIFRLLLKVAVNGTHQCESQIFAGQWPQLATFHDAHGFLIVSRLFVQLGARLCFSCKTLTHRGEKKTLGKHDGAQFCRSASVFVLQICHRLSLHSQAAQSWWLLESKPPLKKFCYG